jgi:phosphoglycolate phosphatase-like HAD superfamily hydrolase
LKRILIENKKLRVFDFDDTLVKTTSYVYITDVNGKVKKLTPAEYAVYTIKPGETADYSEFTKVSNPTLLKGYVRLLKKMVERGGAREVYILTARSTYKPIDTFIKRLGIVGVKVIALGDSNPEKKADWIEHRVKNDGFDDVFFLDDSPKNIEAVKRRLSKYPNVKKNIQLVTLK